MIRMPLERAFTSREELVEHRDYPKDVRSKIEPNKKKETYSTEAASIPKSPQLANIKGSKAIHPWEEMASMCHNSKYSTKNVRRCYKRNNDTQAQ